MHFCLMPFRLWLFLSIMAILVECLYVLTKIELIFMLSQDIGFSVEYESPGGEKTVSCGLW